MGRFWVGIYVQDVIEMGKKMIKKRLIYIWIGGLSIKIV